MQEVAEGEPNEWSKNAIIKARKDVVRVPVMSVRVSGVCAPKLMVSSLETLNKPFFLLGGNALFMVRDAHRCSTVVVESYVPYFRSGRNKLCVVLNITHPSCAGSLNVLYVAMDITHPSCTGTLKRRQS